MPKTPAAQELFDRIDELDRIVQQVELEKRRIKESLLNLSIGQNLGNSEAYIRYEIHLGWTGWDCPVEDNRIGTCVYDKWEDPMEDFCIFCGEPYERK